MAKPISPKTTGTRITRTCRAVAPRSPRRAIRGELSTRLLIRLVRLWFLVSTRSYKFGLLHVFFLLRFLLLHRRKERLLHVRQFGFLLRRQRPHEVRRDHHQ